MVSNLVIKPIPEEPEKLYASIKSSTSSHSHKHLKKFKKKKTKTMMNDPQKNKTKILKVPNTHFAN